MKRMLYILPGLFALAIIMVTVLTLVGPTTAELQVTPADQDPSLVDTEWTLISLNGQDVVLEITLHFSDVEASGQNGCNGYHGPYQSREGGRIRFGGLPSTMMLCSESRVYQEQDRVYFAALDEATVYSIDGDTLKIGTRLHPDRLVFTRE